MSEPNRVVPDASVILKWILETDEEPGLQQARELFVEWKLGICKLFVPSFWLYEVGNVLCLKKPGEAAILLAALQRFGIPETAMDKALAAETVAIAVQNQVAFYDAAYLAVAHRRQAILVTADLRFVRKVSHDPRVRALGA